MKRAITPRSRRAAAMMLALVVLLVVGLISGLSLRTILKSYRQTREEQQRLQAELLADAALSRAILMFQKDPNWKGENWTINLSGDKAAATDSKSTGSAETHIEKVAGQTDAVKITVTAMYPNDPIHRAQAQRALTYTVPPRGEKP